MPPGGRSKDEDQRFLKTLQVRVRKKNPPIERPRERDERISSETPESPPPRGESETLALPRDPRDRALFRDGSETVVGGDGRDGSVTAAIRRETVDVLPRGESETLAISRREMPSFGQEAPDFGTDPDETEEHQGASSLPTERPSKPEPRITPEAPSARQMQENLTRKAADRASTKHERAAPVISSKETSEAGSSLYDRIEDTDRKNDLAQAEQELMQALEHYGHDDGGADDTSEEFAPALERAKTAPVPQGPIPQRALPMAPTETLAASAPFDLPEADITVQEGPPAKKKRRRKKSKRAPEPEVIEIPVSIVSAAEAPTQTPAEAPTQTPTAAPRVAALLDEDETVVGGVNAPDPRQELKDLPPHPDGMIKVIRRKGAKKTVKDPGLQPEDFPEVQPKGRFANLGTDAAGAALMEHAMQARSADLVELKHATIKLYRGQISDAKLGRLDEILSGKFDSGLDGVHSPKRALERLVNERDFNELTAPTRAGLLATVGAEPADVTSIKALLALVKTGALARMKPAGQTKLVNLLASVEAEARVRIAHLAARQLRGMSALEDHDQQNASIIDHISALCLGDHKSPLLRAAGYDKSRITSLVLGTLASPERMSFEEGTPGVLGMFEFGLADSAPAEFARLWREIVFSGAKIGLPSGATLSLQSELSGDDELSAKITPLRVALRGLASLARPHGRSRRPTFIMPGGHGVDADVIAKSLGHLFGVHYGVYAGASAALRTLQRAPKEPRRMPPVYVSVLYRRGERLFVFDHLDDDYVYLRAPHGKSSKIRGKVRPDPEREVYDPDGALDRIVRDEFEENVGIVLLPRE